MTKWRIVETQGKDKTRFQVQELQHPFFIPVWVDRWFGESTLRAAQKLIEEEVYPKTVIIHPVILT